MSTVINNISMDTFLNPQCRYNGTVKTTMPKTYK